jgi:hypothetical protein
MQDNERIQQLNARMLEAATRNHTIKQEAASKLIEAQRILTAPFVDEGEPLGNTPEDINECIKQLQKMIRQLKSSVEEVQLLGQSVDTFRIELPSWIKSK